MNVAYVFGPYRASTIRGVIENIRAAEKVALSLWRQGWAVICPHLNSFCLDGSIHPNDPAADRHVWLRGDLEFIDRLIPGRDVLVSSKPEWRQSRGSVGERDAAINKGIEIFHWPQDEEALAQRAHRGGPVVVDVPDGPSD